MTKEQLENEYGKSEQLPEVTVYVGDKTYEHARIIGNDECFAFNNDTDRTEFFQYMLYEGVLFRAFYEIPEDKGLQDVDFSHPYRIEPEKSA